MKDLTVDSEPGVYATEGVGSDNFKFLTLWVLTYVHTDIELDSSSSPQKVNVARE